MIEITGNPIDIQKVINAASGTEAGAVNVFIGTVRDKSLDRKVVWLEYEAYEPMAIAETRKIVEKAVGQFGILGWAVSHRVGVLKPGEVAVVVAVATRHRKESFDACRHIIDELKHTVPIFKKEVFQDGAEWVSATPSPPSGK